MSFVKSILKATPRSLAVTKVQSLIDRQIEESLNLDYKSIDSFNDSKELSRDVSAFTNSAGGLIILGVEEEKREGQRIFPTKIKGGPQNYTKEALEQRLTTTIQPNIKNLRIYPIRFGNQVIFVIDIPQSNIPPHMASDRRYYFRHNFTKLRMEHYQVADMFGRRRRPSLQLQCELMYGGSLEREVKRLILTSKIINVGHSIAKNWFISIEVKGAEGTQSGHGDIRFSTIKKDHKHTKYEVQQFGYVFFPELPRSLQNIEFMLADNEQIDFNFTLIAENMDKINSRWKIHYNDYPDLASKKVHVVK